MTFKLMMSLIILVIALLSALLIRCIDNEFGFLALFSFQYYAWAGIGLILNVPILPGIFLLIAILLTISSLYSFMKSRTWKPTKNKKQ